MISIKFAAKVSLPLLFAACAVPGFAIPVDFTTTGAFTCNGVVGCTTSNGGSTVTIQQVVGSNTEKLQITATGFTNTNVLVGDSQPDVNGSPLDDANIITFDTTATNLPSGVNTSGLIFTLTIDQTSPLDLPNSGNLGGSFSGRINASGSNTTVNFAPNQTSLTLGGNIVYTLDFLTPGVNQWTIPNPGIGKIGVTTETATVTPEPTFLLLSGLGFAGLSFVAYRRRQTA
ncbi:MAG TPA: PEP-CTERM sorting domain-containing protein [Bryobacteraceae bacterium]